MVLLHHAFISGLCAVSLVFSGLVIAAEDPYLKMLEGEAQEVELKNKGEMDKSRKTNKKWNWGSTVKSNSLPTGLEKKEFEVVLEDNFYGTYVFYKKLSQTQKIKVYKKYSSSMNAGLEGVRTDILTRMKQ